MTFTAKLKRGSRIFTMWRAHHRVSGELHGVLFRWASGGDYATGALTAAQITQLKSHGDVLLEMSGHGAAVDTLIDTMKELPSAPPPAETALLNMTEFRQNVAPVIRYIIPERTGMPNTDNTAAKKIEQGEVPMFVKRSQRNK